MTAETTGLEQRVWAVLRDFHRETTETGFDRSTSTVPEFAPILVALVTADVTPKVEAATREQVAQDIFTAYTTDPAFNDALRLAAHIARSGSPGKEQQ